MIGTLIILLVFLAVPCLGAETNHTTQTMDQTQQWWKPEQRKEEAKAFWGIEIDPHEDMGIGDAVPVRLKSGEQAFVASVSFPTRGICANL
jgi:nitrous oxide reductase accessory protein NosL